MNKRLSKAPLLLLFCATTVLALDPPRLDGFPKLDRIIADNNSGDRFDDFGRQAGVVRQLREAVNILAGNRRRNNQLTPDEDLRAATISTYFPAVTLRKLGYADGEHAALAARGRALTSEGFCMKPKSRWDKQTDEEMAESIMFIAGMVVFMLPFLYRETRRFGIRQKDPKQLLAGFHRYTPHWLISQYSKCEN